jgi:pimeloyl-ACP methyl ester carboxylesterase
MRVNMRLALLVALAASLLALAPPGAAAKAKWLCKPGLKNNPCVSDLTATVLRTDGSSTIERRKNAKRAPIDCFYVYPTVSDQQTTNANLRIDPEIRAIALYQAARFSQVCRVWAPVYRQFTLKAIFNRGGITAAARAKAYNSARAAWREYITKHNHGRGFVLIGHSQGAFVLRQLIREEIDKRPAVRRRMVSGLLLGGNVTVRKGSDVGGDFKNVPACRRAKQTGCVVAYSSFGETPPANALFGRVSGSGASRLRVLCTNPASLGGGAGTLHPYTPTAFFPGTIGLGVRIFTGPLPAVSTPWLVPSGRYRAHCSSAAGANVLRIDSLAGARAPTPSPDATWGYHLGDVNLAVGNLIALVEAESAAYVRRQVARLL